MIFAYVAILGLLWAVLGAIVWESNRFSPMPASAITAVWNGSAYYLFSDSANALEYADSVISDFRDQNHPIGNASPESLITEGAPKYWFKGSYVREDGTFIGAIEALPIVAGDESKVVAEAVTAWNQARDAA